MSLEVAAKRVDLLKQAVPKLQNLIALSNLDQGEPAERQATAGAAARDFPRGRARRDRR
jgi:hypothetical protein